MKSEPTKIVIAEDDPASREMLAEMIRKWGYEVVEAENGADALEKIKETKPQLVVCDIRMPILDGVGLVQALRRDSKLASLPVIALTGYGAQDHEVIASAGFTTYQVKPVNSALLRDSK